MERGTIYVAGLYIQWLTEAIPRLTAAGHFIDAGRLITIREALIREGSRPVDVAMVEEDVP